MKQMNLMLIIRKKLLCILFKRYNFQSYRYSKNYYFTTVSNRENKNNHLFQIKLCINENVLSIIIKHILYNWIIFLLRLHKT